MPPLPDRQADAPPSLERYSRQMRFPPLGETGQRRLGACGALLVGAGALGSNLANLLVRAGIGRLRIADRDVIELSNLHRQVLFNEEDAAGDLPKAEVLRRRLQAINHQVRVEAAVTDVNHRNIRELAEGADILLDGTDNFEARYLLNDLAVSTGRPWIYGACVASRGLALVVIPGQTPCLRCLFPEFPPPEVVDTCDTAGILGPVAAMVAAFQAMEAIKILSGNVGAVDCRLWSFDAWTGRCAHIRVGGARLAGECPCCGRGEYDYLAGRSAARTVKLCGRNAVQIHIERTGPVDFAALAAKLGPIAARPPRFNPFVFRAEIEGYELTLFADGRALIRGTENPDEARSFYARTVGA